MRRGEMRAKARARARACPLLTLLNGTAENTVHYNTVRPVLYCSLGSREEMRAGPPRFLFPGSSPVLRNTHSRGSLTVHHSAAAIPPASQPAGVVLSQQPANQLSRTLRARLPCTSLAPDDAFFPPCARARVHLSRHTVLQQTTIQDR